MHRLIQQAHDFYGHPVYEIDSIDDIFVGSDPVIYKYSAGDGMYLWMMIRANASPDSFLRATFHGARSAKTTLPYFLRVNSSVQSPAPFVLFSDPTLGLDSGNLLTWYVGTPSVDVDSVMERVIRHVCAITGSAQVVFEGSSGGGFVALRMSARFARSVAVVFSPQTDIFRYHPRFARRIRELLHGADHEFVVKKKFPGRFDVADIYASGADRGNLIEFAQNAGDVFHVQQHLQPFLRKLGLTENATEGLGSRLNVVYDDLGEGHFPHPAARWDEIVQQAMVRLTEHLRASELPPVFDEAPYPMEDRLRSNIVSFCDTHYRVVGPLSELEGSPYRKTVPWKVTDSSVNESEILIGEGDKTVLAKVREGAADGRIVRVFLHGPINPEATPLPCFDDRLAVHNDQSRLDVFLSDPMLSQVPGLRVGWYLGNEDWDPLPTVASFIRDVLDIYSADLAVFIGGSSGGFAAIKLTELDSRHRAVTFCPELSVHKLAGSFVEAFRVAAFPGHGTFASVERARVADSPQSHLLGRVAVFVNPASTHYLHHLQLAIGEKGVSGGSNGWWNSIKEDSDVFRLSQTAPVPELAQRIVKEECARWLAELDH